MEERISALIEKLVGYREEVLNLYFAELDLYDPKNGSEGAVARAGRLHDIDRHITNLELEIRRIHGMRTLGNFNSTEVSHA